MLVLGIGCDCVTWIFFILLITYYVTESDDSVSCSQVVLMQSTVTVKVRWRQLSYKKSKYTASIQCFVYTRWGSS